MTQFKDKAGKDREAASSGLYVYPNLMAADILTYHATKVPVGDDQRQHIELMRDIAERFNSRFGQTLVVPEHRIPQVGARIMDLQNPTSKMSTSVGSEQGTVHVLDEPKVLVKKFKSAVTDSGSEVVRSADKPGISNLIDILAAVTGRTQEQVEADHSESRYGDFKQAVADAVVERLTPIREHYEEIRPDEAALEEAFGLGAEKASAIARQTLLDVRSAMGVGPFAR
jgi:tryptophanyl-tRNA synthetase